MRFSFFDHRRTRQVLALLFLFGAFLCLFPPNQLLMLYWAGNSIFVALGYLASGLFFFFINRMRLMFVCMTCCAVICFYYLETTPVQSSGIFISTEPDSMKMTHPLDNEHSEEN